MFHWELGTVPEWFAGAALLLALTIFVRDRRTTDRVQVDLVGTWIDQNGWSAATGLDGWPGTLEVRIRNGSKLPVIVEQLAFTVHVEWYKRVQIGSGNQYSAEEAAPLMKWLVADVGQIAPEYTWSRSFDINPNNLASFIDESGEAWFPGAWCLVDQVMLLDNAGRRWAIQPHRGGPARRVRRFYRPRPS